MNIKSLAIITLLTAVPVAYSHGVTLIDTGAGSTSTSGSSSLFNEASTSGFYQNLAGQFTINSDFSITAVEGWMAIHTDGTLNVVLYDDEDGLPGTPLFTELFSTSSDSSAHWEAFTGLDWNLDSGTYWISFEPTTDSSFDAGMPNDAPQPLDRYAFFSDDNEQWLAHSPTWGQRVVGIPEPSYISMLVMILGGIAVMRMRKRA